eukprot:Nk52_evm38s2630 gene=Nk52_evmTU38s2630
MMPSSETPEDATSSSAATAVPRISSSGRRSSDAGISTGSNSDKGEKVAAHSLQRRNSLSESKGTLDSSNTGLRDSNFELNNSFRKHSSSNILVQSIKNVSLHSLRTQSNVDAALVHTPPVQRIKRFNEQNMAAHQSGSKPNLLRRSSNAEFVGLYDIESTLGKGHFAVVKLARHVFTGERVAVKILDKTKLDAQTQQHLMEEVRIMKILSHPNVVRLYEVVDTPTKVYMIMEYAAGGDLFDYIVHAKGLAEDIAKAIFAQIIRGISYCHENHVVHRDLKPENILFCDIGMEKIKITDFGFGTNHKEGEKLLTACGSLAYSAPEILIEDEYDGRAVDIWSLGVILYMLVVGRFPFNDANPSETVQSILEVKYSIPGTVSESCASLIRSMLQKEISDRATIENVKESAWLRDYFQPTELSNSMKRHSSLTSLNSDQVESIYNRLEEIGIKRDVVRNSLKNDLYDHVSATYHLLAGQERNKMIQEQEVESSAKKMRRNTTCLSPSQHRASPAGKSGTSPVPVLGVGTMGVIRPEDRSDSNPEMGSPFGSTQRINSGKADGSSDGTPSGSLMTLRRSASLDSIDKEVKCRPNDSFARSDKSSSFESVDIAEMLKSKLKEVAENGTESFEGSTGEIERSNLNQIQEEEDEEEYAATSGNLRYTKKLSSTSGRSEKSSNSAYSLKHSKITENEEGDVLESVKEVSSPPKSKRSSGASGRRKKKGLCSDICTII